MTLVLESFISTTHSAVDGRLNTGDNITFRADFDSAMPVDAQIVPSNLDHDFLPDGLESTIGNNTRNAEFVSVDEKGISYKYTVTAQVPKAQSAKLVPETMRAQDPETRMISEVPTGKYTEIHVSNISSDCSWRFSMDGRKTWVDGVGDRNSDLHL